MATDLFANNAQTTLAAAVAAGATTLTVASSTPFPAVTTGAGTQFRVIIDSELFIVTNITGATWTVTPGAEGTTQASHASAAVVTAIITAAALTTKVTSAQAAAAAPVQSVAGRTGAVVLTSSDVSGALDTATATATYVSKTVLVLSDTRPATPAVGTVRIGLVVSGGSTAPGQVTGLTGTPAATSVVLTWTAPASNGGSAITDYLVEYRTGAAAFAAFTHTASATAAQTVTGLTASTSYDFRVSAVNAIGTGTASTVYTASTTAGGAATLAADTFNRADGAITAATTSGGQTWLASGGVFNVLTNQAKIASYGAVGNLAGGAAVIECSNANVTVQVDLPAIATAAAGPGVVFRYVDTSNYYYALSQSNGGVSVGKYVAGVFTPLRTAVASDMAVGDTLQVVLSGTSIIVKKITAGTSTTIYSGVDSALSGTKHGIALGATGSVADRWDNFLVTTP